MSYGSRLAATVLLAMVVVRIPQSAAQQPQLKRPQQEMPEEKPVEVKKPKKGKDPRAVGLLQIASNGKATLIPIAILIDGKFYDASAYKADPVPMALESGTVYEAEQGGASEGLFTVNGALHSKNPNAAEIWFGTGPYVLNGTEVAKKTRKAEDQPRGLDGNDDAPPRLTKGNAAPAAPTDASKSDAANKTSSAASPPKPGENSSTAASQQAGNSSADTGSSRDSQKAAAQPTAGSPNQAANYYRPTLRRGKPTEAAPEEVDSVAKAGSTTSVTVPLALSSGLLQLLPAISDAGGPEPQSYKFFWKEGEADERRGQMLALASQEVRSYMATLAKNRISANATAAKGRAAAHKTTAKPVEPVVGNIRFQAFDAWKNNQPVMILSAEAHFPEAAGNEATPETYDVTIVASTDIYGNLRKIYSGVTDKLHLDVTPRLDLIDVVDADGDGRGELLFKETTDVGSGFVIYRATADSLWKIFDSLSERD
ncbi:MAG: hypothetical protein WBX38_16840 [Candidatus Sulfotelmatobacter sp.]